MKSYLTKVLDWQKSEVVSQYDELPLWSSPFGTLLLDHFPVGDYQNYLDIGCGTGFPLIDISQRLGKSCQAYGLDPWKEAVLRAQSKIETLGLTNIHLIGQDASAIPFPDNHFDLITSNLGINNFENPAAVLSECYRVLKPGAPLCITTNLTGTFREFFGIFAATLEESGLLSLLPKLEAHVRHRGTVETHRALLEKAGFTIARQIESDYRMRFFNGSAFLNHSFIIVGFIDSWREMVDAKDREEFFDRFEKNLNGYSRMNGELMLTVPMLYLECRK